MILLLIGIFTILLFYTVYKMKEEFSDFKWNDYFKRCDIYQGKSHWAILKQFLER